MCKFTFETPDGYHQAKACLRRYTGSQYDDDSLTIVTDRDGFAHLATHFDRLYARGATVPKVQLVIDRTWFEAVAH